MHAAQPAVSGARMRGGALSSAVAVLFIILWASAYVPSKIGATQSPPYWFLVVRFLLAGTIMFAIARALRRPLPRERGPWLAFALYGVLANSAYLGFTYTGLAHGLSSGVGAIVASTNPLVLALIAPFVLREPLTLWKGAGLVLGFGGVLAIVLTRGASGAAAPAAVAFAVAGVVASVVSTILFKRTRGAYDLLSINAISLVMAGLALVPVALLLEGGLPLRAFANRDVVAAMLYLTLVISVGASLLWFWLLSQGEASRVSAFYFLTPAFGLAFGALLLHEALHPSDIAGLAAIAGGIVLAQRSAAPAGGAA